MFPVWYALGIRIDTATFRDLPKSRRDLPRQQTMPTLQRRNKLLQQALAHRRALGLPIGLWYCLISPKTMSRIDASLPTPQALEGLG